MVSSFSGGLGFRGLGFMPGGTLVQLVSRVIYAVHKLQELRNRLCFHYQVTKYALHNQY